MYIPPRIQTLKRIYDVYNIKWVNSHYIHNLAVQSRHPYELRDMREMICEYWKKSEFLQKEFNAKGAEKLSKYWKISDRGLLALYTYYKIEDHLNTIAKYLLEGEK